MIAARSDPLFLRFKGEASSLVMRPHGNERVFLQNIGRMLAHFAGVCQSQNFRGKHAFDIRVVHVVKHANGKLERQELHTLGRTGDEGSSQQLNDRFRLACPSDLERLCARFENAFPASRHQHFWGNTVGFNCCAMIWGSLGNNTVSGPRSPHLEIAGRGGSHPEQALAEALQLDLFLMCLSPPRP